jgi:hypothetical protein
MTPGEGDGGLILEGQAETERPGRYVVRFSKHASSMSRVLDSGSHARLGGIAAHRDLKVHAEASDTHATVTFNPWGTCTMAATANKLTLRIEATNEADLRRIQDIVTRDLDRFKERDHLQLNWRRVEGEDQ